MNRMQPNWACYAIALGTLFEEGFVEEALAVFQEGVQARQVSYLFADQEMYPYAIDLHLFDYPSSIVAILFQMRHVAGKVANLRESFKLGRFYVMTGRATHSTKNGSGNGQAGANLYLEIPRFFESGGMGIFGEGFALKTHRCPENDGMLFLDDEDWLKYLSHQSGMDVDTLLSKYRPFLEQKN